MTTKAQSTPELGIRQNLAQFTLLVMWAPSWGWVLVANVLLGVSQGLTWSTTVIMKIDLAGPERRGLAMGLNELRGDLAGRGLDVRVRRGRRRQTARDPGHVTREQTNCA